MVNALTRDQLPPSLRQWATALGPMSADGRDALGPWISRLSALFGPLQVRADIGRAEPDGYDGITRRGDPERLLASDWLLASEAPEEFERRWVMSELGYLSVARIEPRKTTGTLALLDSGPSCLGGVRVIQLAAVIALAERAERAGGAFGFSMLADPPDETQPFRALEDGALVRWAAARRTTELSSHELEAWIARARILGFEDLWVIGGGPCTQDRRFGEWSKLTLESPLTLGPAVVRARVERVGALASELELSPLPDAFAAQVLRDPTWLMRPPTARAPRTERTQHRMAVSAPVWSASSHKVFARNAGGELLVYSVPTTARFGGGRPTVVAQHSRATIIAAGWTRRRLVTLQRTGGVLEFGDWRGDRIPFAPLAPAERGGLTFELDAVMATFDANTVLRVVPLKVFHGIHPSSTFLAPDGKFFAIERLNIQSHQLRCVERHVLAVTGRANLVVTAGAPPMGPLTLTVHGAISKVVPLELRAMPEAMVLGANPWVWRPRPVEFAARKGLHWVVQGLDGPSWSWQAPDSHQVLGVVATEPARNDAALLIFDTDRGTVLRLDRSLRPETIATPRQNVRHVSLSPDGCKLAFVSDEGAMWTFDLLTRRVLSCWPRLEGDP